MQFVILKKWKEITLEIATINILGCICFICVYLYVYTFKEVCRVVFISDIILCTMFGTEHERFPPLCSSI
jgi:hypothetical protein